jgi:hypothetical protein
VGGLHLLHLAISIIYPVQQALRKHWSSHATPLCPRVVLAMLGVSDWYAYSITLHSAAIETIYEQRIIVVPVLLKRNCDRDSKEHHNCVTAASSQQNDVSMMRLMRLICRTELI